jgi:peptidoglycan/xylan/chitin deacetylase (PgdA/CDA1 family)
MNALLLRGLFWLGIHRLMRFLNRRRVIVLAYHGFTDQPPGGGMQNNQGKHVHVDAFRATMAYVRRHYHAMSLENLVAAYQSGAPIPDYSVVVTIDDGFESNYRLAFPVLEDLQVPATIFVATEFVDEQRLLWSDRIECALDMTKASAVSLAIAGQRVSYDVSTRDGKAACDSDLRTRLKRVPQEDRDAIVEAFERQLGVVPPPASDLPAIYRPLSWSQIREMRQSGLVAIGSHTVSHYIVTRCAPERAQDEFRRSRQLIEERVGAPCRLFCYPNGQIGCFDDRTRAWLQEAGYVCGVTTVFGMNDEKADVFELKRLYTHGRADQTRVIMTLAGVIGLLDRVKRALPRLPARVRA